MDLLNIADAPQRLTMPITARPKFLNEIIQLDLPAVHLRTPS
jgi:hypothetical protein